VGVKVEGGTGVQDHVMFRPVMFGGPCNGDRTVGYEWMAGPQRDASCKRNVYNLTHDTSLQRAVHKHIAHYVTSTSFHSHARCYTRTRGVARPVIIISNSQIRNLWRVRL